MDLAAIVRAPLDLRWLAGFFDGDGSVGIYRRKAHSTDRTHPEEFFISAAFTQRDPAILHEIRARFGGGHLTFRSSAYKGHAKAGSGAWNLIYTHGQALVVLEAIREHVRIKRAEVEQAVAFQRRKAGRGVPTSADARARQRQDYEASKALKLERRARA